MVINVVGIERMASLLPTRRASSKGPRWRAPGFVALAAFPLRCVAGSSRCLHRRYARQLDPDAGLVPLARSQHLLAELAP